jgi:hypothetical protein
MYKQTAIYSWDGVKTGVRDNQVQRVSDNAFIPFDPANTDYQAYLKWVAEGNQPLPADE